MQTTLSKSQVSHRIGSVMSVYQMIDRTIANQTIFVKYNEHETRAVSMTDGETITFGAMSIDDDTFSNPQKIVALDGLNYHELCHVLYTPRLRTLPNDIKGNQRRMMAFNALEDQRIEGIFSTLYPSTKRYFRMAVLHHILASNKDSQKSTFALLYGRKYLLPGIIDRTEKLYGVPENIDKLKIVIDEYIRLDGDLKRQPKVYIDLIDRYLDLLPKDDSGEPDLGDTPMFGHVYGDKDSDHSHDLEKGEAITIDLETASQMSTDNDDDTDGDTQESNDSDSLSPSNSSDPSSDLKDTAQKEVDQIMGHEEIINHVRTINSVLNTKTGKIYGQEPRKAKYTISTPTASMMNIVAKVTEKYRPLVEDSDPGYHSHQSYGRINIDRVMRDSPIDTVFDRWDEGNSEATDLEIVIGLDVSGSMIGNEQLLGEVGWCLKKSLDSLGERCTVSVYTYSSEVREVYGRHSYAGKDVRIPESFGGTNPLDFMELAEHIFTNTNRKHRILITMTDGEWISNRVASEEVIERLNKAGVITGLYHYGHGRDTHRVQVFNSSKDLSGLIRFSENLVDLSLKNIQ